METMTLTIGCFEDLKVEYIATDYAIETRYSTRDYPDADGYPVEEETEVTVYNPNDIELGEIYWNGEEMPHEFRFFIYRADTFDRSNESIGHKLRCMIAEKLEDKANG